MFCMICPSIIFRQLAVTLSLIFLFTIPGYAQLTVNPNQTAAILSSTLAGPGITISSPTLTCPAFANGTITVTPGTILGTGPTAFGISSGIILTSGRATQASGPATFLANTNNSAAGDPALTVLAGAATRDACILEFDFSVVGDSIKFNYQFGSEEYNNSTCGPYNDAFGFFISGPGIVGTDNMALVPGTTIPVTVNSVNNGIPGSGHPLSNCTSMGPGSPFTTYYVDNTGGTQFTYKGFTTKMAAVHKVIPCNTYHLKLTIADAGNSLYDSGVFIEAGSLTTPSITGVTSVCVGDNSTLSDALLGGTWSSNNTAVATVGSSSGVVTGVAAGTTTITYTFGIGCFVTTGFTVNPLPAVITGPKSVCMGSSITLSNATTGGTWSSLNTLIAAVDPVTGVLTSMSIGTVTINYTIGTGCVSQATVTVNPLPLPISGKTTICVGSVSVLSSSTPGGAWSSSVSSVASVAPGTGAVSGVTPGTATISYTLPSGCFSTVVATVKTVFRGTASAAICPGRSYTFGGTVYGAAGSYTHTFTTASCDSIVTLSLVVNPVSNTDVYESICDGQYFLFAGAYYGKTGTYTYTTTNVHGCDSTVKLHLTVNPSPARPVVVSPVKYCQFQPATPLKATGTAIKWYASASAVGTGVAPVPVTEKSGTTDYYVSQTLNGCEGARDTIEVIVYPIPDAHISYSSPTLCRKDTIHLAVENLPNLSCEWSLPQGALIKKGFSSTAGPLTVRMDSTGYYFVKLTVRETGTQCVNADSVKVHIVTAPEIDFYAKPDICLGDTITVALSAATPGITNYIWDFGDATIISASDAAKAGPYKVMWASSGVHLIEVYGQVGNLCRSINAQDTIHVHALPDAKIADLVSTDICAGDSIYFSATDSLWENTYRWAPEHFFQNLNKSGIYGRVELPGYVTLTVTDPFGCSATDRVLINAKSCCAVSFPTAFTPNGDGRNDIFRPISPGHHPIHTFRVANRWGQTVFETVADGAGWDGNFNGVPQNIGTYFYYIKYDCNGKILEDKGDVTLIR